jgi:opacity protein-like surface antigen
LTAGVAFADVKVTDPLQGGADSKNHTGLTVGGGLEWAATRNLSVRAEYLFTYYNDRNYALVPRLTGLASTRIHCVQALLGILVSREAVSTFLDGSTFRAGVQFEARDQ